MSVFNRTLSKSVLSNKKSKKNGFILLTAIALIFMGVSLSAKPILTALKADLVPITNNFDENGVVFVINQGTQQSKSTWLTLTCSGACPDHPDINTYSHPQFPNSIAIKIPALKSGQVFKHKLAFWNQLTFGQGDAKVLFFVDANNKVEESKEKNNKKHIVLPKNKMKYRFSKNILK